MSGSPGPTGLARRRHRLADDETERRMLDTAIAMVDRTGLTVSLEHLSFEDVIRDARVSRSTVYRRWPYKDLFFSDVLKELARAATPTAVADLDTTLGVIRRVVVEHADLLETPDGRRGLLLELVRQASEHDFDTLRGSTEWRTYLALHATFLSVADEDLRRELQETLAGSEREFTRRIATSWELLGRLFGYRLRPELGATFETVATLASADLRGHVILALARPELASERVHAQPAGAAAASAWSLPALALAGIALAFIEPDPDVAWDEDRIERVRASLEQLTAASAVHPAAGAAGPPAVDATAADLGRERGR